MAEKKSDCGCGCTGQKPDTPKATSDKKKPKNSKQCMRYLAAPKQAEGNDNALCLFF